MRGQDRARLILIHTIPFSSCRRWRRNTLICRERQKVSRRSAFVTHGHSGFLSNPCVPHGTLSPRGSCESSKTPLVRALWTLVLRFEHLVHGMTLLQLALMDRGYIDLHHANWIFSGRLKFQSKYWYWSRQALISGSELFWPCLIQEHLQSHLLAWAPGSLKQCCRL